jgi:archaellum component FlaF (FlaF/FlaG flagellin family)
MTFSAATYASIVSTLAFIVSCGGLYVAKRAYDLNEIRDAREISVKRRLSTSRYGRAGRRSRRSPFPSLIDLM